MTNPQPYDVQVDVATAAIRALFEREQPPVLRSDWDENAYVEARLAAYVEALAGLARVRCAGRPEEGEVAPPAENAGAAGAAAPQIARQAAAGSGPFPTFGPFSTFDPFPTSGPCPIFHCPHTGDRVWVAPVRVAPVRAGDDDADPASLHDGIGRALQRVFGDRHGWRRHLRPTYFERYRAWRAVAGHPVQH